MTVFIRNNQEGQQRESVTVCPEMHWAAILPIVVAAGVMLFGVTGCEQSKPELAMERPDVAPASPVLPSNPQPLQLDASRIKPMHREAVAIDLPTVVRVSLADNLDIGRARQRVEASEGRLESTIGAAFPALVPTALFNHVEGSVVSSPGAIIGVGFNTFQASIAVQWVINPGRVVYDIIAAKKRVSASVDTEDAVVLDTLRLTGIQFYELVLAQAQVSATDQSVAEAKELLRINRIKAETGTGVPADMWRAEARLAERQQELLVALNRFYDASVDLAVTLNLSDSTVTLVPSMTELPPTRLVRGDIGLDEMLDMAVAYRPDLSAIRKLALAAGDDRGATWWGAFGPQFQVAYEYGGITGHSNNIDVIGRGIPNNLIVNPASPTGAFSPNPLVNGAIREGIFQGSRRLAGRGDETFSFSDQQRFSSGVGARWSLSAIGDLKTAAAVEEHAIMDADRRLDVVKAQVIQSLQASKTYEGLIDLSDEQRRSAREALRLTEVSLKAGAMTILDVLQAQDAIAQARLRHAEAVVRYNQAEINLLASLGLLTEESLFGQIAEGAPEEDEDIKQDEDDAVKDVVADRSVLSMDSTQLAHFG